MKSDVSDVTVHDGIVESTCSDAIWMQLDRVSVPSPIAVDILMVRNGEGQSSHVLVFCVNFEWHICTHITTSIKCYLNSVS